MFTSQRRTATARAASDCILFHMSNADFEAVIRDYPKYYDDILEKAMERLEMIVRSNASREVRMKQLELRADILRERNLKKLGVQGPAQHGALQPTISSFGQFGSDTSGSGDSGDTHRGPRRATSVADMPGLVKRAGAADAADTAERTLQPNSVEPAVPTYACQCAKVHGVL